MTMITVISLLLLIEILVVSSITDRTILESIDNTLRRGISNHVYPGVVAMAGNREGVLIYQKSFGTHEYLDEHPNSPTVELDSIYDLASVTKVVATTSAVALLFQRGYLRLEDNIGSLLYDIRYNAHGNKQDVTVLNCLLHNAGYQPDPVPGYYETSFGCEKGFEEESMTCLDQIYDSLLFENLTTIPGENFVYSDLSFITLQYVVGSLVFHHRLLPTSALRQECLLQLKSKGFDFDWKESSLVDLNRGLLYTCFFEAFVRKEVFQEDQGWLKNTAYLPDFAFSSFHNRTIPTMDTSYTKEVRKGNVSDSNCFMMGGVCGHAGVFSTIPDLQLYLTRLSVLSSSSASDPIEPFPNWLNVSTVRLFVTEYNSSQSSRALGWTINDPSVSSHQ